MLQYSTAPRLPWTAGCRPSPDDCRSPSSVLPPPRSSPSLVELQVDLPLPVHSEPARRFKQRLSAQHTGHHAMGKSRRNMGLTSVFLCQKASKFFSSCTALLHTFASCDFIVIYLRILDTELSLMTFWELRLAHEQHVHEAPPPSSSLFPAPSLCPEGRSSRSARSTRRRPPRLRRRLVAWCGQ